MKKALKHKIFRNPVLRRIGKVLIIIFGILAIISLILSPILKYLVEKYDVKYTGREITMSSVYVNPFTGYFHFNNFKMYEQSSDSVFLSAERVAARFVLYKLFSKTVEINSLELDELYGIVIQNRDTFNFSDLIKKFSADTTDVDTLNTVHLNVYNVEIIDGIFRYIEKVTPIDYTIVNVNLKSVGKKWDTDTVNIAFSFQPESLLGNISGDFLINMSNKDYRIATVAQKLDLEIFEQYLKEFAKKVSMTANLDADIVAIGNFDSSESLHASGMVAINDFRMGKNKDEVVTSFDKLKVDIIELNPATKKYSFDSVHLAKPYFKYERYDTLDNLQIIFGEASKTASEDAHRFNLILLIGDFIVDIFKNFLQSQYEINDLSMKDGNFQFSDYSTSEKFEAALDPFNIRTDSVDKKKDRVGITIETDIKPYGHFTASARVHSKDNQDFDLYYKLQRMPAALFNPYIITYTSFPLDRGNIELSGHWSVRNNYLQSTNHFVMVDPRVGKRVKKKDASWIPLPLIMSLVRETGNVIDYQIPITGNMKDPNFHLSDVVTDILKNIFIKPPATPYRFEVKSVEKEIENSLLLPWQMRQTVLRKEQEKFIENIADFLKENPDAKITVHPITYANKEREYTLLFEAKKKYILAKENKSELTESDSVTVEKMSSKDPAFVKYLDQHIKETELNTVQEKSGRVVGKEVVSRKLNQIEKARAETFMEYFKKNGTEKQVKLLANVNRIPYNGFSYFKIDYSDEVPESLLEAYEKLYEFNMEGPRKKYLNYRKARLERLLKIK